MVHVRADERCLLRDGGVVLRLASPGLGRVVVVIAPLSEVVCKFKTGRIGRCVLEVDDYELLV